MPWLLALTLLLAVALAAALGVLARDRAGRRRAERERDASKRRADEIVRAAEEERSRATEAERRARMETEAAERAKDEFVATVSHELRTPLNAVLGWVRLLRLGGLDAARTARAIEVIERSASAQAQIVDDLLDVSRIARGDLRLDVRSLELTSVVEAAIEAVRPAAEARQIVLWSDLSPRVGRVAGDPGRLQQVVWNLLSNAIKFTPPGGTVDVRLSQAGERAVIEVRDTGPGIDPAFAPHLFERFRQADSSSTRVHGGLGLGLSIVRQLVEAHGGDVSASSDGPERGSVFTVRLPVSATPQRRQLVAGGTSARAPTPIPAPRPLAPLDRLRVLVVDDDDGYRKLLGRMLSPLDVSFASGSNAALELLTTHQGDFEVIVSKVELPDVTGAQLFEQIKRKWPHLSERVIFTSSHGAAPEGGILLRKPINRDSLLRAIGRVSKQIAEMRNSTPPR